MSLAKKGKEPASSSGVGEAKAAKAEAIWLSAEDWDAAKERLFDNPLTKKLIGKLLEKRVLRANETFSLTMFGKNEQFLAEKATAVGGGGKIEEAGSRVEVTAATRVEFVTKSGENKQNEEKQSQTVQQTPLCDFGQQRQKLLEIVDFYLVSETAAFIKMAGVMVFGEKGCGKSTLLKRLSEQHKERVTVLNFTGKSFLSSKSIDVAFLKSKQPFLFLIDDLEERSKEMTAKLIELFETCRDMQCLIVASCRSEHKESYEGLYGPARFETEVEIEPLGKDDRGHIYRFFLTELIKNRENQTKYASAVETLRQMATPENIEIAALRTSGFVIYDIKCLVREIELLMFLNPVSESALPSSSTSLTQKSALQVLKQAFTNLGARSLREYSTKIEKVRFEQIGGYESVKRYIRSVVELPLKKPQIFIKKGIKPSKGILLYGPPGCSKTMFAKAIATESNLNFISVKGPELFNKWVGSSEKKVRELFKKARFCSPCVIFFDEIDAIAGKRSDKRNEVSERILTQLLTEIDGVEEPAQTKGQSQPKSDETADFSAGLVIVIGATNRPDSLDPAILRPGRFDELVYVPLPDKDARHSILQLTTSSMPLSSDASLEKLVIQTDGYSGAEIVQLCKEAAMQSIYREEDTVDTKVTYSDFEQAFKRVQARTPSSLIKKFETFDKHDRSQ